MAPTSTIDPTLQRAKTFLSGETASRELPAAHRPRATRYFFFAAAILYTAVAIGGFAPEISGEVELAHPLFAYVHGGLMLAWLLLFVAQTGLAASGSLQWHRRMGFSAIGLAAVMWISMGVVSVAQLARFRSYDLLLTQLVVMVLFAGFFVWGILVRRHASAHKRLLTLATLVLLQPALDRMSWLPAFDLPAYWPQAVWLYAMLLPLIAFDVLSTGRLHPVTLIGTGAIVVAHTIISLVWTTPGWLNFAQRMSSAIH